MFSDWFALQTQELKVAIEAEDTRSGSRRDNIVARSSVSKRDRLEQLDLGHNLISTTAAARGLSFNGDLKLPRLEGNPVAEYPRNRPALTCLLPHVLEIDSRGMPPSFHKDRRGPAGFSKNGIACSHRRGRYTLGDAQGTNFRSAVSAAVAATIAKP